MTERAPLQPVAGLGRTSRITPPPPRTARPPQPAEESPKATPAPTKPKAPQPARVSDTADTMRVTTLSLPTDLVSDLKARATAEGVSQADVILDAIAATKDALPDLLTPAAPAVSSDGLFVRASTRTTSSPLATLSIRLLQRNLAVIDQLVATSNAPSRSKLCAVALRTYLAT